MSAVKTDWIILKPTSIGFLRTQISDLSNISQHFLKNET